MPLTAAYWAEHAWLPDGRVAPVVLETADGRLTASARGHPPAARRRRPARLHLPGLANSHSHAFHRALRGRVQVGSGTFWTWRDTMYQAAARLTPDTYHALARAVYAEMALAGITSVGEFHYLHHAPGGYALRRPQRHGRGADRRRRRGGHPHHPPRHRLPPRRAHRRRLPPAGRPPALRFGDGTADGWYERWSALKPREHARIGAALHSVRAFSDEDGYAVFADRTDGLPVHIHLSEQPAENEACRAVHGRTPARLLHDAGFWRATTTAVHATHLTVRGHRRPRRRGRRRVTCARRPSGTSPTASARPPRSSGRAAPCRSAPTATRSSTCWSEARAMELDERLRTRTRGHWTAAALLRAATADGQAALGYGTMRAAWSPASARRLHDGRAGHRQDGRAATPSGSRDGGIRRVRGRGAAHGRGGPPRRTDGAHALVPDVARALAESIAALYD